MLVLWRKPGEKIFIGDQEATIVVLGVEGKNVRLGLDFPATTKIEREERYYAQDSCGGNSPAP